MKHFKLILFLCILMFVVSCGQQKRYISYKVKKGETIQSIAKKLNVNKQDLLRLNPDIINTPKTDTTIIIPNKKEVPKNGIINPIISDSVEDKSSIDLEELKKHFIIHKVKKGNTVYSLKHFYNVSEEELYALNPNLKMEGLKLDSYIKIKPIEEEGDQKEHIINKIYKDSIKENMTIKLAMLLPFRANEYDTITPYHIFKKNKLVNIVTDFYMGAKIAIDSIKKQGVNIKLQVFDTGKRESKINAILDKNNLNDADVIIGPFYSEEAKIVANEVDVPVIFPHFSKDQKYFSSSNLIKTSSEKNDYQKELISYLIANYTDETIVIVGDGKEDSDTKINEITLSLKEHDSIAKIHVLKPEKGYIKKEHFTSIFKPKTTNNWVILATNNSTIVADAVNSLISLPKGTTVQTFALNKENTFDKIDNNLLSKIGFTYVTNQFIDQTDFSIKTFDKKYLTENNALPSDYAIKGFDVTYDVLVRLASGENLEETFEKGTSYRLVSKFEYHKKPFGSTENNGLFIVKYNPDLSLKKLK